LNGAGYVVCAQDHRGHGRTARAPEELGFFAASGGWRKCVDDLWQVNRHMAAHYPGLPIALVGHSMGSFLVQHLMEERGEALAGVVLAGSDGKPGAMAILGRLIARLERLRLGPRGKSRLIHALAFGAFNRAFEPARTSFDWLSRDPAEVDSYLADLLCGFGCSTQLWIDLLDGLNEIAQPLRQAQIPKRLPIHLMSGMCDPVGDRTRGPGRLLEAYRRAGLSLVTHRFYPGARHELFHEVNREEVTRDLISWLDGVLTGSSR